MTHCEQRGPLPACGLGLYVIPNVFIPMSYVDNDSMESLEGVKCVGNIAPPSQTILTGRLSTMMIWDTECDRCKARIAVLGPPPSPDALAYCPKHRPLQARLL